MSAFIESALKRCGVTKPARAWMYDQDSGVSSMHLSTLSQSLHESTLDSDEEMKVTDMQFAVCQEKGYKYTGATREQIHDENEDVALAEEWLFIVADGHGGREASVWFVANFRKRLQAFRHKPLRTLQDRQQISQQLKCLFADLDEEYLALKRGEWQAFLKGERGKVCDDGCALNVTMIVDGCLVNCNVGDSRAVLGAQLAGTGWTAPGLLEYSERYSRESTQLVPGKGREGMSVVWASCDHNMTHPQKIGFILEQKGAFLSSTNPVKFHNVKGPEGRGGRPYSELIGARIYIPKSPLPYLNNRRTLNLSSTMGDLLFKPTLDSTPDVRFVKLEKGVTYCLVVGSDGVWDHLDEQRSQDLQNISVMNWVEGSMESEGVDGVCVEGCKRDGGIYVKGRQVRVDDVTFMVAQFQL